MSNPWEFINCISDGICLLIHKCFISDWEKLLYNPFPAKTKKSFFFIHHKVLVCSRVIFINVGLCEEECFCGGWENWLKLEWMNELQISEV